MGRVHCLGSSDGHNSDWMGYHFSLSNIGRLDRLQGSLVQLRSTGLAVRLYGQYLLQHVQVLGPSAFDPLLAGTVALDCRTKHWHRIEFSQLLSPRRSSRFIGGTLLTCGYIYSLRVVFELNHW